MPSFLQRLSKAFQKDQAAPATALTIGSVINSRYRLESEIGRGGMGIVYRAHDIPNDREVAVKVINLDRANALSRGQFAHEADIAARLSHPHIVAVHETGSVETGAPEPSPYLVMELVRGTSLAEMSQLTYARILELAKQICEALTYAHSQGIIYRDLKPGNVLVEKRGFEYFAKLMDFGLARPRGMEQTAHASTVAGTLFYLAPELITGQPADIASDLYAFGATLYEMITGRVPFDAFDEQTILTQHLQEPVPPPSRSRPDVPPALETIVLRLLEKDPADRFASAQEVCAALEQVALPPSTTGNLPSAPADFTNSEEEHSQIRHLLESNRLVTLLGANELLALATASQLSFPDGTWWVDLGPVTDPRRVPETVASILGICPNPNRSLTVSLVEHLREKSLLLLLIDCDHVLGGCRQLTETLLQTCPEVYILVTSRQPLNVPGETCWTPSGPP